MPKQIKALSDQYRARLVHLFQIEQQLLDAGASDRRLNAVLYLMRRAFRPLYEALRDQYRKAWGPRCSYSYFAPRQTHDVLWRQARAEFRLASSF